MSLVQLKNYQSKVLDTLKAYLVSARLGDAKGTYDRMEKPGLVNVRPYRALADMHDVPYVCLRLPTGGGKTLLAAHTVKVAAETYMDSDFPVVLWLVPSKTIQQQTMEVLKDPNNANYQTLRKAFDGHFRVLDISDFTLANPHDFESKAVIFVGTMQSLRVENTEGRKVYDHHEDLEPHFRKITRTDGMETGEGGKVKFSFANLLHHYRPLVIVDEAQNFSTNLSADVKKRVNTSCVVEFTATPSANSNVLHSVSAMELKAEEMIKLPIVLTEHTGWAESVRDAVLTRKRLEDLCGGEDEYIRPIVLFQAESQGEANTTWQVLKQHLLETEQIPDNKIAVVTGDQRELDGINLFDRNCPIDFVITVQALKEGWDCSFAYVFCSVANINSAKDVEQLLGRVLRMPYAKRRKHEDLNRAYAHVSSASWPNAVKQLSDRMVKNMGFEEDEVDESIETRQADFPWAEHPEPFRKPEPFELTLTAAPVIPQDDVQSVVIERHGGSVVAKVIGVISQAAQAAILAAVPADDKPNAKVELQLHQATMQRSLAPANKGEKFIVPQLCLNLDGVLELPDALTFQYAGGWKLAGPAKLTEFTMRDEGRTFAIDIEEGHIRHNFVAPAQQIQLELVDTGWTVNALSQWLDKKLRQPDVSQPQLLEYCRSTVAWLEQEKRIPLAAIVRGRFYLQKLLEARIVKVRAEAKTRGYQALLFDAGAKPEVTFDHPLTFAPDTYYPSRRYRGAFKPQKHFYPVIGDMNGEEAECAKAIEMLGDKLKYWVRNMERNENAFRLPTSTDYFYPDFVVMLTDGRILVVEYKGEQYRGTDDVKEKQNIGELWAKQSKGKGLFLMAWAVENGKTVFEQVKEIVGV